MGAIEKASIASNLRALRARKRVTQKQVADAVGVSDATVSSWESGTTTPNAIQCAALAGFYRVSVDRLIGFEPLGCGRT